MKVFFADYHFPQTGPISFAVDEADDVYTEWVRRHFELLPEIALALALVKPGDVVLDIGANIGAFAIPLGKAGCRVFAVEALARNYCLLAHSILKNRLDNVVPLHLAVWKENTVVTLGGYSAWGQIHDRKEGERVPALTLDALSEVYGLHNVGLLKIDIEGAELPVLQATERFFRDNPGLRVIFESNDWTTIGFGYRYPRLLRAFEELGFDLYLIQGRRLVPRTSGDFQEKVYADYLAVPAGSAVEAPGFTVGPLTAEETAEIILIEIRQQPKPHRAYLKAEINRIPAAVRSLPAVAEELEGLETDPDPELADMVASLNDVPA